MKFAVLALSVLVALPGHAAAEGLSFDIADPAFTVTVPNIPSVQFAPQPLGPDKPHVRLVGTDGLHVVTVFTPTVQPGTSAQECASAIIGSLPKRPEPPSLDQIYKARLDPQTFVAIYGGRDKRLYAHLLSAAPGYCIEVRISREWNSADEARPWFSGFGGARIDVK